MILGDILLALILGTVCAAVFGLLVRSRDGMLGVIPIFILFFLFAWAGGLWLRPAGPPIWGLYWLPGLILVLLIFLLLVAVARRPPTPTERIAEKKALQHSALAAIGATFWFIIGALIFAIFIGYLS